MKLAERAVRHERQGSSRYLLEPNVKEGKGGLRDLQTLYWIAKYLNHAKSPEHLTEMGVFSPEEYRIFTEAEEFLWTTRVHLHLLNGRASEQLTFDTQVEIADILGYRSTRAQRGVERFMQDYFIHAKNVGDLTRIFLTALESRHVKPKPRLGQKLRSVFGRDKDPTGLAYRLNNGRLDLVDPDSLQKDPVNILRLFREGLATDIPVHPDALRRVAASLSLIDDRLRADPEANRIFLELLLSHNNPERALRLMNEVGVLGAFIPQFGRIVAMMQFNMYHYYTVDEHIIRTISTLSQIERGDLVSDLPVATDILERGVNRKVIYLALLLHDIGKGSGRDHSTVGAEVAAELAPRFGLDEEDTQFVVWLVRNHLLMSDTAQKRDLTDPRTARDFAATVKSPSRLKLLTVLTVCDIRGVGPNVWNNWKAMLLRNLYADTLEVLTGGTQQSRPDRAAGARELLRERVAGLAGGGCRDRACPTLSALLARVRRRYPPGVRRPRARPAGGQDRVAYRAGFQPRCHAGLLCDGRPSGHLRAAGRSPRPRRRQRRRRAHLHHDRRHRHRRLLAPGRRGKAVREGAPDPAAQRGDQDPARRDPHPRGAEGQGPPAQARAQLRRADAHRLRQ